MDNIHRPFFVCHGIGNFRQNRDRQSLKTSLCFYGVRTIALPVVQDRQENQRTMCQAGRYKHKSHLGLFHSPHVGLFTRL